jgi:hypothetical protein
MSNEAEAIETERVVYAEISNVFADGKNTTMDNAIASLKHLLKIKELNMMERAGALKGLSNAEKLQMFKDI